MHSSVGAIIRQGDKFLMINRRNFPYGWACPSGHVDDGETPEQALKREILEETGLEIIDSHLLIHEFVKWNKCSRGIEGHDWFVYEVDDWIGDLKIEKDEAKSHRWIHESEIKDLELEKVWKYWFEKLEIL